MRVRWFRGPVGRDLSRLTEPRAGERRGEESDWNGVLAWLLVEGRTNEEIARELGVGEDVVARRVAEMYARVGVSSPAEGAVFALRAQEL